MVKSGMWIDSHAHVDAFVGDGTWPAVRERARLAGVSDIVAIGGTPSANALALQLAESDAAIHAVIGYDRDEANHMPDVAALREVLSHPRAVGVGETGLDYHYQSETAPEQQALLQAMLDCAYEANLPVVIHTREAEKDTLEILGRHVARWDCAAGCPGVIHCFTGEADFARAVIELGFMISFSGIVTFKKADRLREALRVVPDDRLLIETDAPYLAPVPHRGKRNEPAWVAHTGEFVASCLNRPVQEIAVLTSRNARRLFRLPVV